MKTWKIVVLVIIAPAVVALYSLWSSLFFTPAALVNKATDPDKMLANYEWFYEASNNYRSRVGQIAEFKGNMAAETDKAEVSRIRVDLSAVKQSCRDLVSKYEAKSGEIHVGYLKSKSLPESLNMKGCE